MGCGGRGRDGLIQRGGGGRPGKGPPRSLLDPGWERRRGAAAVSSRSARLPSPCAGLDPAPAVPAGVRSSRPRAADGVREHLAPAPRPCCHLRDVCGAKVPSSRRE